MNAPQPDGSSRGEIPADEAAETRYVGYCDILGFSNRILTDFDKTLEVYKGFADALPKVPAEGVETTIYSDAVLVTSFSLPKILSAIQALWFVSLTHNMMLRGAITKGRYWERRKGGNLLVASDALARAVKLERSVGIPAVVISDDVEVPDELWFCRFTHGAFVTPILHFRDRNIVNPFNLMWGTSARDRATHLMAESPAHKDKYLWFLALLEALRSGQELIPPDVLIRFLRTGILREKPIRAEAT